MRWILVLLLLPLCYSLDYYVSPAGVADCSAMQNPATPGNIETALSCLSGGGNTIRMLPGSYNGFALMNSASGQVGNENILRSDDGSGGYARDSVIVSGSAPDTAGDRNAVIFMRGLDNWIIEGISIDAAGQEYGFYAYDPGTKRSNIQLKNLHIYGNMQSNPELSGAIMFMNAEDIVIEGCTIDVLGAPTAGIELDSDTSGTPCSGARISGNNISGRIDEYAIGFKRYWDAEVYNNYIHDLQLSSEYAYAALWNRHGGRNKFYNNLIKRGSGNIPSIFATRGMSTGGSPAATTNTLFAFNTIDMDGGSPTFVYFGGDISTNNNVTNNLILDCSGISDFFDVWMAGSNNIAAGNKIECNVGNWHFSDGLVDGGENEDNIEVVYNPDYTLQKSLDGIVLASPAVDHLGNARGNPPDVGAFEFLDSTNTTEPGFSLQDLISIIEEWKQGEKSIQQVMEAIQQWKS